MKQIKANRKHKQVVNAFLRALIKYILRVSARNAIQSDKYIYLNVSSLLLTSSSGKKHGYEKSKYAVKSINEKPNSE